MDSSTPVSHWIGFHVLLVLLLGVEWIFSRRAANRPPRQDRASEHRTAVFATILWVGAALLFALFVLKTLGGGSAIEYISGYSIEEALSVDNLFVFLLLFRAFSIGEPAQPKVLFWGVAGAVVLRGAFIVAGIGLLQHFHWISYIFGAILLAAAIRLLMPEKKKREGTPRWLSWLSRIHPVSMRQDRFVVREEGHRRVTVLLLALIAIELTDVVFALDSIPAVLSVTRHPFLAYTSNIMAVMGLRSLFFLLTNLLSQIRFLHYGLAGVLGFAGFKMVAAAHVEVGPLLSLGVIVGILAVTVALSLAVGPKGSKRESAA